MTKKQKEKKEERIGFHFGKTDLERIGLFIEMEYMNMGGYLMPVKDASKKKKTAGQQMKTLGPQIMPQFPKSKCGLQDGYFQEIFGRIFIKEAYQDQMKLLLQNMLVSSKKNISGRPFVPAGETKKHSTPGDIYGTFIEKLEAFSPITQTTKKKKKGKKEEEKVTYPPNCLVSPGKKGGPGYINITIGKYPEYKSNFYDAGLNLYKQKYIKHKALIKSKPLLSAVCLQPYFDNNPYLTDKVVPIYNTNTQENIFKDRKFIPSSPGKKPGGCKDGCFPTYPTNEKYQSSMKKLGKKKEKKEQQESGVFYPQIGLRSKPTMSIVNHKVDISVNATNWKHFQPLTFP